MDGPSGLDGVGDGELSRAFVKTSHMTMKVGGSLDKILNYLVFVEYSGLRNQNGAIRLWWRKRKRHNTERVHS